MSNTDAAQQRSDAVSPSGCRWCGEEFRTPHGKRWTAGVGWHAWTEPTDEQRLERMQARRHTGSQTTRQEDHAMPDGTSPNATVEKILYFDGQPTTYLARPIPTVCRTTADRSVRDEDGCGGTGWICPACHEGDDCMTVNSDECRPGRAGALSCVCAPGQSGDWEPSTWA